MELPKIREINNAIVQGNYTDVMQDVLDIIHSKMERLLSAPGLMHLVIKKG